MDIGFVLFQGLGISKNGSKVELVTIDEGRGQPKVVCYSVKEDKLASFPYCPLEEFGTANSKVRFLATYENTLLASDLGGCTTVIIHGLNRCSMGFLYLI